MSIKTLEDLQSQVLYIMSALQDVRADAQGTKEQKMELTAGPTGEWPAPSVVQRTEKAIDAINVLDQVAETAYDNLDKVYTELQQLTGQG